MRTRTPAFFLAIILFGAQPCAAADTVEASFQDLALKLVYLDKQTQARKIEDPLWRDTSRKIRDALKNLVSSHPKSIWADDAQFLVAMLSSVDKTDVVEKELFLVRYPNAEAEQWTAQKLDYLVPAKLPLDLSIRMELVKDYVRRGDKEKLSKLCQDSAVKYPERAVWFKTMKNKASSA